MNAQQSRYLVTLNAPTAVVKTAGHELTSYVDQDTVYHLSILDKSPIHDAALQYHTVVRICLDDAPQERSVQKFTPSERVADGSICALEYAPFPLPPGVSPQVLPALHSSFEKSFSVLWSFNSVTGGSYCLIPIRFRNCRGLANIRLKLFAGTERLQLIDASLSQGEQYEESFACVRLFSSGEAQKTRAAEIAHVEEKVAELQSAIEQVKTRQDKTMLGKNRTDDTSFRQIKAEKPPKKKRKVSGEIPCPPMQIEETSNLIEKLSSERQKLSRVRPVQVFRQTISTQVRDSLLPVPSHQTKHSNFAPQIPGKGNGSKHQEPLHTATYNRAAPRQVQASRKYDSSTTSPNKPSCTTKIGRRNRSSPAVCFYVRPEHIPNANYIAIYLSEKDFPSLLSTISSKLHVQISKIGSIYYYDHCMTPVVVNEETIKSVSHEQDLIVRLPRVEKQCPELSVEAQHQFSSTAEHFDHYASTFDHYLTLPPEDLYATSAGTWSDIADDASIPMSHTFARSTPLSPEAGVHHEGYNLQCRMILGEQEVDYASYMFDAHSNSTVPASCLYSASISKVPHIAAPLPISRGNLPSQAKVWHASTVEDRYLAISAASGRTVPAGAKTSPPSYNPSTPHSPATEGPPPLRDYRLPPTIEREHIRTETPKHNKLDTAAANSLERNRLAAMKCRSTRKEKVTKLQELSTKKLELNTALRYEIQRLNAEITEAKGLLEMHVGCS